MHLVEQQVIARGDPRSRQIDAVAFASKNLWNAANYLVRQSFIHEGQYLKNAAISHVIKDHEAYQALPRKVSNQVLLQVHKAWVGRVLCSDAGLARPPRAVYRASQASDGYAQDDRAERARI